MIFGQGGRCERPLHRDADAQPARPCGCAGRYFRVPDQPCSIRQPICGDVFGGGRFHQPSVIPYRERGDIRSSGNSPMASSNNEDDRSCLNWPDLRL